MSHHPLVVIVAGPNGAGKTTASRHLLQGALGVNDFVNADAIASGLSAFHPESVAFGAGRVMLARLRDLAKARSDFAFETTLASRTFAPWLEELKASGYRTHLAFISLSAPDLDIARVAQRVRSGGHHIPEETIRRRYESGLRNFFGLYRNITDTWELFDNSELGCPLLVARGEAGGSESVLDQPAWRKLLEVAVKQRARPNPPLSERVHDDDRAREQIRLAVQEAVTRHKKLGQPVSTWRNGRVEWIQPEDIPDFDLENGPNSHLPN